MSNATTTHTGDAPDKRRSLGWRIARRACLGLILTVVVLVILQVALDPTHENELGLRGGLDIDVDPNVEVYIGNNLVGTGSVQVTWDQLLGTTQHQPLATAISGDAPSPNMRAMGGITAEALAGDGSEIVWKTKGMGGNAQRMERISFAWTRVLLRRQDGSLDYISVLDGEFPSRTGKWRRFLIPIRLRSSSEASTEFFSDSPSGGIGVPRAGILPYTNIGSQLQLTLRSVHEAAPDDFADEIASKGLWRPRL